MVAYTSPALNVMVAAARKAGRPLIRDFNELENLQISMKGPADFVTSADKRTERILIEELSKDYVRAAKAKGISMSEWVRALLANACAEDDLASRRRVGLLHELLQVGHASLHRLGRLQHFGHDQLVVIEQPADLAHAGHQRTVDDVERVGAIRALAVEVFDEVIAGNLRSHFLCAQAALPLLHAAGNASMVQVASTDFAES